jgi:hypothetical protein
MRIKDQLIAGITISALLVAFNSSIAIAADEMLSVNSYGYGGVLVNSGTDVATIPMYARLRDLVIAIPKANPDAMILKIRFDGKTGTTPLEASKKLSVGAWIYGTYLGCAWADKCTTIISVGAPLSWVGDYPTSPTSSTVEVFSHGAGYTGASTPTGCQAPWWIDRSDSSFDAIAFQLSITCLNIPKDMYGYAYASADIGITPLPYNYTTPAELPNSFWQLAAPAYTKNGGKAGVTKPYNGVVTKTITCTKGKVKKQVSGTKPVCPKGYFNKSSGT